MEKLYRVESYQVVANRWPGEGGGITRGGALGPDRQTRYQAKKLLAKLRRTMPAAWLQDRSLCVRQERLL